MPGPAEPTPRVRRLTLTACLLGWMFDGMDFMVVALLAKPIAAEFGVSYLTFGLLALLPTKLAAAAGGIALGSVADRFGRRNVLAWSILLYAGATGAAAFAPDILTFALLRAVAGIGLGAEWAVGFALLNEVAADPHRRGLLGGLTESLFAAGYILASLLVTFVGPVFGWRGVLLAAAFPALLVVPIRRLVPESSQWAQEAGAVGEGRLADLLGQSRGIALRILAVTTAGMFAVWLVVDWLPTFLADEGYSATIVGIVPPILGLTGGAATFAAGALSDRWGRRRTVVRFAVLGVLAMAVFAVSLAYPGPLLVASMVLFGCSLGFFGVFGAWFGELLPTRVRATGLAFAYNGGRAIAALAGVLVPLAALGGSLGAGMALSLLAFLALALLAFRVPEGRPPRRAPAGTPVASYPQPR